MTPGSPALIDWSAIVDRTRNVVANSHWASPARILDSCVNSYAEDKWSTQPYRVEVWIEKEALASVFEPVCAELDVPMLACRGYTSQSEMWSGGRRLLRHRISSTATGQEVVVLHFGDHDPSGIDMSRDICDRLRMFLEGESMTFERLALNMDQVEEYNPPPNPAKMTDSRFAQYVALYGDESWELDALEPSVLADLIRANVLRFRDQELWHTALKKESRNRMRLAEVRDGWDNE